MVPTHHHYLNQTSDATWQGKPYGPPPLSTKGDHHKNTRKGDFQNRQKILRPQFLRPKKITQKARILQHLLICNKSAFMVLIGIKPMIGTCFSHFTAFQHLYTYSF